MGAGDPRLIYTASEALVHSKRNWVVRENSLSRMTKKTVTFREIVDLVVLQGCTNGIQENDGWNWR
jgi:hypothetical protein